MSITDDQDLMITIVVDKLGSEEVDEVLAAQRIHPTRRVMTYNGQACTRMLCLLPVQ